MTATELQRIALNVSNSLWCRHWLNFNHPQNPRKMAIQALDCEAVDDKGRIAFRARRMKEFEKLGFEVLNDNKDPEVQWLYTIARTNEDGTPFFSEL